MTQLSNIKIHSRNLHISSSSIEFAHILVRILGFSDPFMAIQSFEHSNFGTFAGWSRECTFKVSKLSERAHDVKPKSLSTFGGGYGEPKRKQDRIETRPQSWDLPQELSSRGNTIQSGDLDVKQEIKFTNQPLWACRGA